jgi:hypothetical protein
MHGPGLNFLTHEIRLNNMQYSAPTSWATCCASITKANWLLLHAGQNHNTVHNKSFAKCGNSHIFARNINKLKYDS